jgi:hypothetical protein
MLKRGLLSAATMVLLAAAQPAHAALQWSDDSFHLWGGTAFREPYNPDNISKTVLTYTHVDGYKWGGNFLNLDFLYSDTTHHDNLQGLTPVASAGALEVYAVYRNTLSFNKITDSKKFELGGVIRDVGFVVGTDLNTKNHAFSSRKIMPTAGLALAFNVPGFLNVEFLVNKEWGVNGIAGRSTSFNPTGMLAFAWGIPLYGPISFEGFGDVNLPKGNGGFGSDTVTEVLVHPKLMVDVGQFFGSKGFQFGVGYEYWLNKFGNDHNVDPTGGSYARTLFGEFAIHL